MSRIVEIDPREITITPVFKTVELENVPKSETAGYPVMELHEVVEVRFAGSKNYAPVFPADSMWKREGNSVITFAERWPEQYRQFKEGNPQEAMGTPLDMLRKYGVTPEGISLCRALRIYSIEALHFLEGDKLKSLGMSGNALKKAAREFMAERSSAAGAYDEIALLKAELAQLRAGIIPPEASPAEVDQALEAADEAYANLTDAQIKDKIALLNDGNRPKGNPSRSTLTGMLRDLEAA